MSANECKVKIECGGCHNSMTLIFAINDGRMTYRIRCECGSESVLQEPMIEIPSSDKEESVNG